MRKRMAKRKLREAVRRGAEIKSIAYHSKHCLITANYYGHSIWSYGYDKLNALNGLLFCIRDNDRDFWNDLRGANNG